MEYLVMRATSLAFIAPMIGMLLTGSLRAQMLLRGTVGNYPIVMQLDIDDTDHTVSGSYFYEKYKQDIPLRGSVDRQTYQLNSDIYDSNKAKADRFSLTHSADTFTGTFTSGKRAALPVTLHVIASTSVSDPRPDLHFSKTLSGYEKLRLADIKFVAGKKATINGKYLIQWYTEPVSHVAMFHVIGGYPESVMGDINRIIDQDYYQALSGYFGCPNGAGGSGTDMLELSHYFLNDRFVSYSVSDSWSCYGTAHPDFGITGTTIDVMTGKKLSLEDVYWLGTGSKPVEDSKAWYQYRDKVLGPAIVTLFKQLYPQYMAKGGDDDCDYTDPEVWNFPPWYLTDKGMYIGAYFARAQRNCDNPDWSIIPYSVLQKNHPELFAH